jgi:metal-responsive CopG/Arc/MetJ family transcriptional regulator
MVRTQIYLTQRQRDRLAAMARAVGKKQSELIRDAIDRLIEEESKGRRESILRQAAGMWKDRKDLPDFRAIRAEWKER